MIELIASLCILGSVYLTTKINIYSWLLNIIGCILYLIIFYENNLMGQVSLQIIFIVQTIFGWVYWKRDTIRYNVTNVTKKDIIIANLILIIGFPIVLLFSQVLDGVITILSLIATYFLIKKYVESWYLWIFIDILSIYLFLSNGLYITTILYVILLFLAIKGLTIWKRNLRVV